jgi:DNA polymerase-1
VKYDTILSWELLDTWLARLQAADLVAVDTETTSLDEMRAEIVGISFSVTPGEAAYIPLAHNYGGAPDQLPRDEVLARLKPWLEDAQQEKAGPACQVRPPCVCQPRHRGAGLCPRHHAAKLCAGSAQAAWPGQPGRAPPGPQRHQLRRPVRQGRAPDSFSQVDIAKAAEYSCEDSDQTLDVHLALWPQLEQDEKLRFIYQLEMDSSETLYRIERNGVLIDAPTLATQSHELGQRIMALEAEAHDLAGQPFNLGSPKQIGEIFFTKLGLPVVKKTATGAPSTDEEVLEKLAEDYPLPAKILEHRGLAKLKGTYTDKLAQLANPRTGRVHTHYAQAVAVTGRLSSNDPNLQNIPIRTAEGRRVREAFRGARRLCDCQRRLQPDRAAHHGPHQRRRGPAQGVP